MAVRAAELSEGGFSGRRLIRFHRAKAPNTTSQKEEAIQAKRMAKRPRMIPSRKVKPSIWNTPTIRVTAATVEARTRKKYSQRRGAMSATAALDHRRHAPHRHGSQRRQQIQQKPAWPYRRQTLRNHRPRAWQGRAGVLKAPLQRCLKCARLRIHIRSAGV